MLGLCGGWRGARLTAAAVDHDHGENEISEPDNRVNAEARLFWLFFDNRQDQTKPPQTGAGDQRRHNAGDQGFLAQNLSVPGLDLGDDETAIGAAEAEGVGEETVDFRIVHALTDDGKILKFRIQIFNMG